MGERVYEHMVRFTMGSWTFRFWLEAKREDRALPAIYMKHRAELEMMARALLGWSDGFQAGQFNAMEAAEKLADGIPTIAAVEVLDPLGNGALCYPSWP